MIHILRIEYRNLPIYDHDTFAVDLYATDRVVRDNKLHNLSKSIYVQNTIAFSGINATGKSTALRLINLAVRVVIDNISLNDSQILKNELLADDAEMIVTFCNEKYVYELHSCIGVRKSLEDNSNKYFYKEETLKEKTLSSVTSRNTLLNFQDDNLTSITRRSHMDEMSKKVIHPDDSIVIMVSRENGSVVRDLLAENYINMSPMLGDTPVEVLNAFDDNIEYLRTNTDEKHGIQWLLKFKNSEHVYRRNNPLELNRIISAGTIKGHALVGQAIRVLKSGGYLIVDELENHFNKELVHMILELFNSEEVNPHGACLIFSTHYAEILDFLTRKDDIYITRKKNGFLSVSKLSTECKRNDIKKSDLFISNCLKGTAPKYQQIQKLKESVCRQVK